MDKHNRDHKKNQDEKKSVNKNPLHKAAKTEDGKVKSNKE